MNTLGLCATLTMAVLFIAFLAKQDFNSTKNKNYSNHDETVEQ